MKFKSKAKITGNQDEQDKKNTTKCTQCHFFLERNGFDTEKVEGTSSMKASMALTVC